MVFFAIPVDLSVLLSGGRYKTKNIVVRISQTWFARKHLNKVVLNKRLASDIIFYGINFQNNAKNVFNKTYFSNKPVY